jgi:hypothetical protein
MRGMKLSAVGECAEETKRCRRRRVVKDKKPAHATVPLIYKFIKFILLFTEICKVSTQYAP